MRLLIAHKVVHKSIYPSHSTTKVNKAPPQPYVRFLQSWILLALLFTFLFSVSNVVVHWITPYLPQAIPNEQNTQLSRTHSTFNSVWMPKYASCLSLRVEHSQNLEKVLPLLQDYLNTHQHSQQMLPLCIIQNRTQTAI